VVVEDLLWGANFHASCPPKRVPEEGIRTTIEDRGLSPFIRARRQCREITEVA
jgi:hypothetical protein